MSAVRSSVLDRTIDLGEHGKVNALWHCFGVRDEIVDFGMACRMLDASGTSLLPINTNQFRPLIGHGDVTWEQFKPEAEARGLVPCLNINLQTSAAAAVAQAVNFRKATGISLLKLEVLDADDDCDSNDAACIDATSILMDDGFKVMPLISADPTAAATILDIGVPLLRVMGSPIGSGRGIVDADCVALICEDADVPVILDGGIGSPGDARFALELGCDGFLVNSALFTGDLGPDEWLRVYREAVT